MSTTVTYFFQGEPGETQECPNAFTIPGQSVTFDHFLRSFPPNRTDPLAKLHFRFCARDKTYEYIWVDVTSKDMVLPLYKGVVCAKVLRMDSIQVCKRYSRLRMKKNTDCGVEGANAAWKVRHEQREAVYSDSTPAAEVNKQDTRIQHRNEDRQQHQASPVASPAATSMVDIFDSDSAPVKGESETFSGMADAFAPTKTDSKGTLGDELTTTPPINLPPVPVQLDRAELVAKREAQLEENVSRALEDKQERDDVQRKESDGMEVARLKHDASLTEWAFDASKKKRNVRTLLTTMQKVLWEGNRWTSIGLGDVLQPKQVKLKYRKAMLVVHPDRLSNEVPEVRFIAKRIFEAINEQYQEFLKSESVE